MSGAGFRVHRQHNQEMAHAARQGAPDSMASPWVGAVANIATVGALGSRVRFNLTGALIPQS